MPGQFVTALVRSHPNHDGFDLFDDAVVSSISTPLR